MVFQILPEIWAGMYNTCLPQAFVELIGDLLGRIPDSKISYGNTFPEVMFSLLT